MDLKTEIEVVEKEMAELLSEAMVSDLANEKYKELEVELRRLKWLWKEERREKV